MSAGLDPTAAMDPVLALPTDLGAPSMSDGFPAGMMADHHLLLLADDVAVDEVEALALSLDLHSGWVGAGRLQVAPGAYLLGPWQIPEGTHASLGLPSWVSQVMVLDCPPQRAGALPGFMVGKDALMDCFPQALPTGLELAVLERLRDIARRLAGALRVAPGGQVVTPDPERSTMLAVYSPVWLTPDAAEVLLARFSPEVVAGFQLAAEVQVDPEAVQAGADRLVETVGAEALDAAWALVKEDERRRAASGDDADELDGYSLVMPIDPARQGWGGIELRARGVTELPLSVLGEEWAAGPGALRYVITWQPVEGRDAFAEYLPAERAAERHAVRELIEQVAAAVLGAVGGVVVDDCGFLVSLEVLEG